MSAPTVPIRLPPSSSTPLPPNVRSAINAALLSSNAIPKIQAALLHECQASGFVTAVRARVLELLRTGECGSYGELMRVVMGEVRGGLGAGAENGVNGAGKNGVNGGDGGGKLKVPQRVVEEGVNVVRAALEPIVVVGEDKA